MESRFVTIEHYVERRNREDMHIKNEFVAQRSLIESVRDGLQEEIRDVREEMRKEFRDVREEIRDVREEMRKEFRDVREEMRKEFRDVREEMRKEFRDVREEISEIKVAWSQLNARRHNGLRKLPYHVLASLPTYHPDIGLQVPRYFPRLVKDFWNLQFPQHEQNLLYLVQFYDIQGYEYWGGDEDYFSQTELSDERDFLSNDSSPDISIEEAVRNHPLAALKDLATMIGLEFQELSEYYRRVDQHRRRSQLGARTRPVVLEKQSEAMSLGAKSGSVVLETQSDAMCMSLHSGRPVKSESEFSDGRVIWDPEGVAERRRNQELIGGFEARRRSFETLSTNQSLEL
ncbi:hypothetical protein EAF04_010333 [Stromatinia cepivora]|nr:hypothetical protein EAF04_010333 [Stromatinia cepivora]